MQIHEFQDVPENMKEAVTVWHGVGNQTHSYAFKKPCLCMVLWLVNSAYVAGVHTPAKPVCGRHVAGAVVL